jgi:hypothetical protein
MTNHAYLLLTPERPQKTPLVMKHLGQRHMQYVNLTYRHCDTLEPPTRGFSETGSQ